MSYGFWMQPWGTKRIRLHPIYKIWHSLSTPRHDRFGGKLNILSWFIGDEADTFVENVIFLLTSSSLFFFKSLFLSLSLSSYLLLSLSPSHTLSSSLFISSSFFLSLTFSASLFLCLTRSSSFILCLSISISLFLYMSFSSFFFLFLPLSSSLFLSIPSLLLSFRFHSSSIYPSVSLSNALLLKGLRRLCNINTESNMCKNIFAKFLEIRMRIEILTLKRTSSE